MSARLRRPDRIAALQLYFFSNAFKWNLLHPLILPALTLRFAPEAWKNSALGLITFGGLLLAAVLQPLTGALSDRWPAAYGGRRGLMLVGGTLELVFLFAIGSGIPRLQQPWVGLSALLLAYLGLQFASNLTQGPAQGLVPNRVAADRLGLASGLKNLFDMLGLALAALLGGRLLAADGSNLGAVLLLIAGVHALSLLTTLSLAQTEPAAPTPPRRLVLSALWSDTFSLREPRRNGYLWLIWQRFFFLLGIYGLQAFIQYYLRDVLHAANPVRETGDLLAALTAALTLLALLGGWLADRMDARRLLALAGWMSFSGYLLALTARTIPQLVGYGTLVGGGLGLFLAANWAQANRLAPPQEAGRYLGLTNLATAGAAALARLEGPLIDGLNAAFPQTLPGYRLLFLVGAGGALAGLYLLRRIPSASDRMGSTFEHNKGV